MSFSASILHHHIRPDEGLIFITAQDVHGADVDNGIAKALGAGGEGAWPTLKADEESILSDDAQAAGAEAGE